MFQYLATRSPFDDTAVRDDLRERINRIPEVDLPASRLTLRPSFPVDLTVESEGLGAAMKAHTWFLDQVPSLASHG